jgi:hypothetical protein
VNCEILSTLYIRSNGDIPCNDDAGEKIILGQVGAAGSTADIASILHNNHYTGIREAFRQGRVPWPNVCPSCAFFRADQEYIDLLSEKRIRKLQIEPSLACNLRCPGCSNLTQIKIRPKPFRMELAVFEETLRSLRAHGFAVDEIEYCGQGEPLLHPGFPQFVRLARDYFPRTTQRLITSGNFDYWKATAGQRLDEIFVSCDGLFQRSYEQYRVGGKVERAIQFMRDAPREIGGKRQALIWKYILFEFNDSDAEICQAQQLANEIGVDTLLFVFTHSAYKSLRYTAANVETFPVLFPNVTTNATPIHYNRFKKAAPIRQWRPPHPLQSRRWLCVLDTVAVFGSRWLDLQGWALARYGIGRIEISVDGRMVGLARLGISRPDVFAAHPEFDHRDSGFTFTEMVAQPLIGKHEISVRLFREDALVGSVHQVYDFRDLLALSGSG